MTRKLLTCALLTGLILILPATAYSEIVGDYPEVVIFGGNAVQIGQNSTVFSGDVVTNNLGGTMSLGNKVTTPAGWQVKADSLSVGNFVNLNGDEFCNSASGGVVCAPLSPLPVYPENPVFQDYPLPVGGPAVIVPNSGSATLYPGKYGVLDVGVEGTVTFVGPGEFNFASFTAGRKGQFLFTGGPIEIRVLGNFITGVEDNLNLAETVPASQVVVYVAGSASLGDKTNVNLNIWARGQLQMGSNVMAKGAYRSDTTFLGGQKSQYTLRSFWDFPPVANDDTATTDEDNAKEIDVLANDADGPDTPPDAIFVGTASDPANGTVTCSSGSPFPCAVDETLTYTPDPDYFGADSFTYEACDVDNQINVDNCAEATVDVTVNSVNDPPVAVDDSASMDEDGGTITIDVLLNDTAGPANEDQARTLDAVGGSGNSHVKIVSGKVEYTPNPDFNGTDGFDYTVCDGGDDDNTATDPDDLCDTGSVVITVNPVNDPPEADGQAVLTSGAAAVLITLTGSDIDGDSLTFSIVSGPDPAKGSLSGLTQDPPSSATVTYTPVNANNEDNEFTFQVDDGNGGTATGIVSINPVETCESDADCGPGFVCNLTESICEPAPLGEIDAKDKTIEANVDDQGAGIARQVQLIAAAPNTIGDLTFAIVGGPTNGGSLSPLTPAGSPVRSATVTYTAGCTPAGDPPVCVDSFDFKACDAANPLDCDTATVTVNVSPFAGPTAPVAEDAFAAAVAGDPTGTTFTLQASTGGPPDEPAGDDGRQTSSVAAAGGFDPRDNGSSRNAAVRTAGVMTQVQLGVGTGWQQFTWWDATGAGSGVPDPFVCTGPGSLVDPATNLEGPFTFDLLEEGCLSVTDVLLTGDRFEILNNGQVIDTTTLVPQGGTNVGDDPDAAFASPQYSSRFVPLPQGSYSIQLRTIPGNSLWCGRGYLRVDELASASCVAEPPLLTYTILTVPDASFGTLFDSGGQQVTAGTVLTNPNLTFVAASGATGTNTQTTFEATNTFTQLVSNVAIVSLGAVTTQVFSLCLNNEDACDKGRPSGSAPITQGGSAAELDAKIGGPRFTVEVEGKGDVSTSRRWHDGVSYEGVVCSGGASCGANFGSASEIVLYARPTEHDSEFVEWGGDCRGTDPVTVVTVRRDTVCTAVFRTTGDQ